MQFLAISRMRTDLFSEADFAPLLATTLIKIVATN
jgi:hypothetical protein